MVADHVMVKLREGRTEEELRAFSENIGAKIRKKMRTPGMYLVALERDKRDVVGELIAQMDRDVQATREIATRHHA